MSKMKDINPEDLRSYELMVIVVLNLGEAGINKELDKIRKLIKSYNGAITNEDIWGHRELAYRIKKNDAGFYAVFNFESTTDLIPELHKILSIENNIIRHFISKPPKGYVAKTLQEYEAFDYADDEEKKKKVEKEEARRKPAPRVAAPRPVRETPKVEEKSEAKPSAVKPEKKLADLDEKLKSIIDDTDLNL